MWCILSAAEEEHVRPTASYKQFIFEPVASLLINDWISFKLQPIKAPFPQKESFVGQTHIPMQKYQQQKMFTQRAFIGDLTAPIQFVK